MVLNVEIVSIIILGLLCFLTVLFQASYLAVASGAGYGFTNRDVPPPGKGPLGYRIDNTLNNLQEGLAMYLPLVVASSVLGISNEWTHIAAWIVIISRCLYVPIYFAGIQKVRTLVWTIGFFAIPAYAVGILKGLL